MMTAETCCQQSRCQEQGSGSESAAGSGDKAMYAFWQSLPLERRRHLCTVPRKTLFEAIRSRYCSRCFGLFALRYEELRCSNGVRDSDGCPACKACPACQDFFLGLKADGKSVSLEEGMLQAAAGPFEMFAQSKTRERERDLQFMTAGDVCGSGFSARRNGKVCALHTTRVSSETLLAYWNQLPPEHCTALFSLPRHDFEAELDSCCSMQLRICKDCRYNVLAQYKLALSAGRKATSHGRASADGGSSRVHAGAAGGVNGAALEADATSGSGGPPASAAAESGAHSPAASANGGPSSNTTLAVVQAVPLLPVCEGFSLSVTDATVQLVGTDAVMLLEEAEEIEDLKAEDGGEVRHAETPELAQEALIDAVILIFKAQVEVAFREQTAGHNVLLLLVALSHELLEGRLRNAFLDIHARAAEVELLELVAEDEKRLAAPSSRSRRRKKCGSTPAAAAAACRQPPAAAQVAATEAAASDEAVDGSAPSTPTKAEERPPVLDSSSAEASPREQPAASEAAAPQLQAASPELSDHGAWQHERQSHGEWEVQSRGRKSRRTPSRAPGPDEPAASPPPPVTSGSATTELQPADRAQQPPPPPPLVQHPHSGEQQSAWASVVSGAASPPMQSAGPTPPATAQAAQQAVSAAWPQLPHTRPQAMAPAVPQPSRLRREPQRQQQMAPGPRQPPPGFSQCLLHQHQQPHTLATVSRRSSTEYSLWGEDAGGRMPLSLSASRESLASASDMSFGSPPLSGGLQAGGTGVAVGSHSAGSSGQLPAGCSLFKQQPCAPPLAAATPSLFQQFGQAAATSAPRGQPTPAAGAGGALPESSDAFSLFSSFPAASRQQVEGGGRDAASSPWSGAMPAGFAALFGGSGFTGHGMAHTMLA